MNEAFRRAAGRSAGRRVDVAQREPDFMSKPGDFGAGRGGSSAPHRRRATANEVVNARIRRAVSVVRQAELRGGIAIDDLDPGDPWRW
jgi:hypothetical protein